MRGHKCHHTCVPRLLRLHNRSCICTRTWRGALPLRRARDGHCEGTNGGSAGTLLVVEDSCPTGGNATLRGSWCPRNRRRLIRDRRVTPAARAQRGSITNAAAGTPRTTRAHSHLSLSMTGHAEPSCFRGTRCDALRAVIARGARHTEA